MYELYIKPQAYKNRVSIQRGEIVKMTMKWFVYELLKNGKQSNLYNEHLIEKQLDNFEKKDLIEGILEYISSKNN